MERASVVIGMDMAAAQFSEPWRVLYPPGPLGKSDIPATALDMFRTAVARSPHAPAVIYFDASLDYAMLDALSDRLAHYWLERGVERGDRIAVVLQNVPQFPIAAIAAWKIGAIPVTVNPMYRKAELEKLFSDCEPRAVLCHDDHYETIVDAAAGRFPADLLLTTSPSDFQTRNDSRVLPQSVACADLTRDLLTILNSITDPHCPPCPTSAEDTALLLYTSGTTGTPKGAMLSHRSLTANAALCRDWFSLGQGARIFGVAPLFHITGFEIHMCAAFIAVAPMILTYRFAPAVALDAFREHRPTFIIGAITAFVALMQVPDATEEDFRSFTHMYSGGAPIPPAVIAKFEERFGKKIRSSYGMTETTAPTHFSPPTGQIPVDQHSGALSIGVPIPGTEAVIVNDERQPLPIGEVGELRIRGRQIMKGYWRKPEETREVLADGWMYTGDIGFRDQVGWFYLVDRKKDMIIASGFKVWPREVEDVLYMHPAVREAAVVGEPDAYRGESVVAFISFAAGASTSADELIIHCRSHLAAYKCPRKIIVNAELPKTMSGKIMRSELRDALRNSLNHKEN